MKPINIITIYSEQCCLVELQILVIFPVFLMGICSLNFAHIGKVS